MNDFVLAYLLEIHFLLAAMQSNMWNRGYHLNYQKYLSISFGRSLEEDLIEQTEFLANDDNLAALILKFEKFKEHLGLKTASA